MNSSNFFGAFRCIELKSVPFNTLPMTTMQMKLAFPFWSL